MDDADDLIVVFGETNDYSHSEVDIGTFDDRTPNSFYGACHYLFSNLIKKYLGKPIVIMTPLHLVNEKKVNSKGGTLKDYVAIIREVAECGLGDWCQANTSRESAFDTPAVVTNSILTVDIADKAAFIYEVLEMKEQQEYALKLAQRVRTSIRNKLYDTEQFTAICKTQTAQAMAVFYNIFEPDEKPKAIENLVKLINEIDNFIKVGVLGGRVIFRVLADYGYADLAYDMITRPEFPSYGNWIKRGATTLWELFTLDDTAKGSLNHHFWGDVSAWFYIYLAGIRINPNLNNVNEINIEPCFVEKLDYVKATHKLPSGGISVEWKRTENGIYLEINCPQSVKGNIILNGGYTFENGTSIINLSKGNYMIFSNKLN